METESPYSTPVAAVEDRQSPASFGTAASIFWSIFWRSMAIGIPVIFITGITTAGLFSSLGNDGANLAARIATLLVMIPVQIYCIKLVIGVTFGKYRLELVKLADAR
jgi:hypothetical protein